jgi:Amidase
MPQAMASLTTIPQVSRWSDGRTRRSAAASTDGIRLQILEAVKRYGNAALRDVSPQAVFEFAGAPTNTISASHCGVVGLKTSAGAIPSPFGFGGACGPPYGVTAPMGRTAADARMTFEVMAGPDPRDPHSVRRCLRVRRRAILHRV